MAVPKKKRTKSSVGKRRSHHGLTEKQLTLCPKCNKAVKPHTVCPNCGTYKKKEILKTKTKSSQKTG